MINEFKDEIPIVFVMDRNYIPFATVATHSLLKNSLHNLKIYWILPKKDLLLASECVKKLNTNRPNKLRVNIIDILLDILCVRKIYRNIK